MKPENLKCPKCGYIFEADTELLLGNCPLCSNEYAVNEALRLYNETKSDIEATNAKPHSKGKIIAEWALFFGSFTAFIIILYHIISYILGA